MVYIYIYMVYIEYMCVWLTAACGRARHAVPAHRTACEICRPNGRVGIVALTGRGEPPPDFNPLAMTLFYAKGISLVAINGPEAEPFPAAAPASRAPWRNGFPLDTGERSGRFVMDLIRRGQLRPSGIITHRLPARQIPAAYAMIYEREKTILGCVFEWDVAAEAGTTRASDAHVAPRL